MEEKGKCREKMANSSFPSPLRCKLGCGTGVLAKKPPDRYTSNLCPRTSLPAVVEVSLRIEDLIKRIPRHDGRIFGSVENG